MQFLQDFHCFIIFLLCHSNVLGFYCSIFCLLRHYTISSRIPLFHYLFVISLLCSQLRLFPLLFVTSLYYLFKVSIISLAICFITSLLCSQLQNKCLEIEIIQGTGTTSGDRPMGRPKTSWLCNIRLWTGLATEELLRTVEDRKRRNPVSTGIGPQSLSDVIGGAKVLAKKYT